MITDDNPINDTGSDLPSLNRHLTLGKKHSLGLKIINTLANLLLRILKMFRLQGGARLRDDEPERSSIRSCLRAGIRKMLRKDTRTPRQLEHDPFEKAARHTNEKRPAPYEPQYARVGFLRTSTSRYLREANEVL